MEHAQQWEGVKCQCQSLGFIILFENKVQQTAVVVRFLEAIVTESL